MKKLEIIDLHIEVEGKEIVKGISLTFHSGKIHAIMGPNGSGKSTLAHAIMGHPKYKITSGKILLNGEDITQLKTNERAKKGLFLSFQYPAEITGVTLSTFLRTASENLLGIKHNILDFHRDLKIKLAEVGLDPIFGKRYLNEGFSGGEKKRAEILQLKVLEPKFAILDEPDSGADADGWKMIEKTIQTCKKESNMGIIFITHYNHILSKIHPEEISVFIDGKVAITGGKEIAERIEKHGFQEFKTNQGEIKNAK